jgi:hypothetical protein
LLGEWRVPALYFSRVISRFGWCVTTTMGNSPRQCSLSQCMLFFSESWIGEVSWKLPRNAFLFAWGGKKH